MNIRLSEDEYKKLTDFAFRAALKFLGDPDKASDVAQNALLLMLSSKTEIENPFAWMKTTVRREASKAIKDTKKIEDLEVSNKAMLSIREPSEDEENANLLKIGLPKVFKILSKEDYEFFKKYREVGFSIHKFAEKEKLSYEGAHTIKKRIKRNIDAYRVVEDGWKHSARILDFQQMHNINEFIRQVLICVKNQRVTALKRYLNTVKPEDFEALLNDVAECIEWTVTYKKKNYDLDLLCKTAPDGLKFITLVIEFVRGRFVRVLSAQQKELVFLAKGTLDPLKKYEEKGKISLQTDQMLAILTDKHTNI